MKYTVSPTVEVPSYSFPGLYPIYYATADAEAICPDCVNANRPLCADPNADKWYVTDTDINYEDPELYCAHCNQRIESAYAETD